MSYYIRVWQACDIQEISKQLLIVGDVSADCAACRELGIEWLNSKTCPKCGVQFRFISSRNTGPLSHGKGATVRRIKEKRPDLTFIDHEDYKEITGKQSARDFFNS